MWRGPAGSVAKTVRGAMEGLGVGMRRVAVLNCPHGHHHIGAKKRDKLAKKKMQSISHASCFCKTCPDFHDKHIH